MSSGCMRLPLQAQLRWLEDLLIVLKDLEIGFY